MSKTTKKKENKLFLKVIKNLTKVLLIFSVFFLVLIQTNQEEFSNSISLLAVNENEQGNITGGNIINLELTITPGNGEVFVNANSLKEIDTQLSITNGKDIACDLLNLNCDKYNYYYTFKEQSVILKGPSATASIALLTAKTINQEKIPQTITMTGSLNSAGVVGIVGGIPQKIELAQENGFEKVLVPLLGSQNNYNTSIEVVPVLDFIEAYNAFDGMQVENPKRTLDKTSYNKLMSSLVNEMCGRTSSLQSSLQNTSFDENTSNYQIYNQALNRINSSLEAKERNSFYSAASFCFGANNNLQTLIQFENQTNKSDYLSQIKNFSNQIDEKQKELNSQKYIQSNIRTQNDFYTYLILQDRINEAKNFINPYLENETNATLEEIKTSYAFAKERYETIDLWAKFIVHQGDRIYFTTDIIENACVRVSNEIETKARVLHQYEVSAFDELIEDQKELQGKNPYQCLYNGLELQGRIDTVFFSFNIEDNSSNNIAQKLFNLTQTRIARDKGDNFPLIPFIYYEYSEELYNQEDYTSSLIYTNYALSFSNVDFYLQKQEPSFNEIIINAKQEFTTHPLVILALLLLIGFL